jgi:hypothetical protein
MLLVAAVGGRLVAAEPKLDEHLTVLAPYVGKTWKGEFKNSTKEKPLFDVARWEVALKGKAVRITHSVNDGVYGGESLIVWDAKSQKLVSYYFTTAGFFTEGMIEINDGRLVHREVVHGQQPGVSEVESVNELRDGRMYVKSRFLRNGEWVDAHEITYVEAAEAKVVLD